MGAPLFTTIPQADRKFVHFPVLNGEPMRILPPPTSVPFFQPPTPLIFPAPIPVPVPLYSLFSLVPSSSLIPFHPEGLPRPLSTPPLSALASSLFAPSISSPSSPSLAPFQMTGGAPLPERPVPLKAQLLGQEERASSSEDNTIEISQGETSDESVPSTPRELSPHVGTQESTEKRYLVPGKSPIRRGQDKEKRRRKIFEPAIRCNNDLMHIIRSSEDVTAKIFPIDQQIFKTEVVLYRGHIIASVDSGVTVNKPKITDGSKRASTQHNDCLRNLGFSEKRLAKRQKDGVTYFIKKIDAEDTYKLRGSG